MGRIFKNGTSLLALVVVIASVVVFGFASSLMAAKLLPMSVSESAGNSADDSDTGPRWEILNNVNVLDLDGFSECGDTVRYSLIVAVDVAAGGGTKKINSSSGYSINFVVDAEWNENWKLYVRTWRKGELTIVHDGGRKGHAYASGVSETHAGAVLTSGGLNLPYAHSASNHANPSSDAWKDIMDGPRDAVLTGTGPTTVLLNFAWSSWVESDHGTIEGGDEAAFRLGESSNLARMTACDYPGPRGRTKALDGHFVVIGLEGDVFTTTIDGIMKRDLCGKPGDPCRYLAWGTIDGCIGNNYTVEIKHISDPDGALICSDQVVVTNGNPSWISECIGNCTLDSHIEWKVIDDPGKGGFISGTIDIDHDVVCGSNPVISIEKTHGTLQGHYEDVSITFENSELEMGGFDFLVAYDASALTPADVTPGQLLEDCGWEYFTYRHGADGNCGDACPSGLLRIIALAEIINGPFHPSCYGPPDTDPHELAKMKFLVSDDRTLNGQYVPIRFFWSDCSDNSISSVDGQYLMIDRAIYDFEGNLIWNEDDDDEFPEDDRIPFVGAPDYCLNPDPDKPSALRFLDFYYGGIDIIADTVIDARGDINLNGVVNEVADAVMFTNFFISGLSAFGNHVEGSIAASDVNADGVSLSVGDLVYLIRIITGDAPPYPKIVPYQNEATLGLFVNHSAASVSAYSEANIGAGYFVFEHEGYELGEPQLINGASNMTLKYSDHNGVLKILLYSFEKGVMIPAGSENIIAIPISGEGSIRLAESQLADYYGNMLTSKVGDPAQLPVAFALHQNYPNPFNPKTTILYELPEAARVKIEIFNVLGQKVVTLIDSDETVGIHSVSWDSRDESGSSVSSGIYLYRITSGTYTAEKKMVLMK